MKQHIFLNTVFCFGRMLAFFQYDDPSAFDLFRRFDHRETYLFQTDDEEAYPELSSRYNRFSRAATFLFPTYRLPVILIDDNTHYGIVRPLIEDGLKTRHTKPDGLNWKDLIQNLSIIESCNTIVGVGGEANDTLSRIANEISGASFYALKDIKLARTILASDAYAYVNYRNN